MLEYIALIKMFAGNFAPTGTVFCKGQLLSIAEYTAVFAIVGTTFGGDGVTTFGVPDLRGRSPLHIGQGPGTSSFSIGEMSGQENVTLTANNLPSHNHPLTLTGASSSAGASGNPEGKYPAQTGTENDYSPTGNGNMAPYQGSVTLAATGGNQSSISLIQPYLTVNYIFVLEGIFPSRN